ncbi:MAG: hypothetical protein QOD00_307 [Blastocatellia bacterium]|nr:hypothetical protein [Blastocatellia bacterium]
MPQLLKIQRYGNTKDKTEDGDRTTNPHRKGYPPGTFSAASFQVIINYASLQLRCDLTHAEARTESHSPTWKIIRQAGDDGYEKNRRSDSYD